MSVIDSLTFGEIKELMVLFSGNKIDNSKETLNSQLGKKVIIRTHSAGVWFGELEEKCKNEVILKNARRMWRWWAAKSVSLSGVSQFGIQEDKSQIAPAVERVWLEAIEILSLTDICIKSIEGAQDAKAE
jgi:hypothetical protein